MKRLRIAAAAIAATLAMLLAVCAHLLLTPPPTPQIEGALPARDAARIMRVLQWRVFSDFIEPERPGGVHRLSAAWRYLRTNPIVKIQVKDTRTVHALFRDPGIGPLLGAHHVFGYVVSKTNSNWEVTAMLGR